MRSLNDSELAENMMKSGKTFKITYQEYDEDDGYSDDFFTAIGIVEGTAEYGIFFRITEDCEFEMNDLLGINYYSFHSAFIDELKAGEWVDYTGAE